MRNRTIFLILLLIELLSLLAFFLPSFKIAGFAIVIGAVIIASLIKLEYGLYAATAELIIGGMGYLFSFPMGPNSIPLRLGIFLAIMAVWAAKILSKLKIEKLKILRWETLPILIVIWGIFIGFLRHNDFGNLFLDANGYLFIALILPFLWVKNQLDDSGKKILQQNLITVFFIATTWLALKTLLTVYFLTHLNNNFFAANFEAIYHWVRDTGVGEITWLPGNFARVFFQSHIYNIAAFFILLTTLSTPTSPSCSNLKNHAFIHDRKFVRVFLLCALNVAVIIISLSRSFWVGVAVGLIVLTYFALRQRQFKKFIVVLSASFVLGALLLIIAARFPIPKSDAISLSGVAESRLAGGEAISSRWNLLPPLWSAVKKHWFLGQGFGATVTYISNDPRVRAVSPTGLYTTYAFEWGWLDLWLKLGLVGLLGYLCLLCYLLRQLWQRARSEPLYCALFIILASLIVINIFTPYLNHPLGFGILILISVFI
ncbi:MAG: O-antigen ligase family protein [bacterium]|nr:O-antigen ligase family protein [bacterium]